MSNYLQNSGKLLKVCRCFYDVAFGFIGLVLSDDNTYFIKFTKN